MPPQTARTAPHVAAADPGLLPLSSLPGVGPAFAETLAKLGRLTVHACPVAVPTFTVKQHWHARYHQDPGNRWLRNTIAALFLQHTPKGAS